MKLRAYIDGACGPVNPKGNMGYSIIVQKIKSMNSFETENIHSAYWFVEAAENNSNNKAEYLALEELLNWLTNIEFSQINIHTDSQLVVKQMNGLWQAHGGVYLEVYRRCSQKIFMFKTKTTKAIHISWIPREKNTEADELSKKGFIERGIYLPY